MAGDGQLLEDHCGGGALCADFQNLGNIGFRLVVGDQTFTERASGFAIDITCPDGTSFHNGRALDLLGCPTGFFGLPGEAAGWTDTSISYSFIGIDPPVPVFDCSK